MDTRVEPAPSKPPTKCSKRIVCLVSPIPISNTSPPDEVTPPELILNVSKVDMCFTNSSEEVEVVYEEAEGSDDSTIPYVYSPNYVPGSSATASTVCHTPEIFDIRPNPLTETR